jgi:acyl-CoA reductase-like NAD-dependent aldehyde dehydrogenase
MDTMLTVHEYGHWIAGASQTASSGATFEAIDPTTGAAWGRFADGSAADIDRAVNAAHRAFASNSWRELTPTRRGRLIMKWADLIAASGERLARIETEQNGKLLSEMSAQFRVIPEWMYYFGSLADKIEGSVIPVNVPGVLNYTLREPYGVVAVLTPWNSPTFLTMQAATPALAAGNTVVIKPSEVTSASIIEAAKLAEEAGFPPGVVNVVTGEKATGAALVDHPLVRKITFTGGVAAGRQIAEKAGWRLIPVTLELGGKSPQIVFGDANLDAAEAGLLAGIFAAAGQSCAAGSRAYIESSIYDEMVERLVRRTQRIKLGNPVEATTQMGPVATRDQFIKDRFMVGRAIEEGAELLCGGKPAAVEGLPGGFFFEPTILGGVDNGGFLARNEVFGPVLGIARFETFEDAIVKANDTNFGLAAGVWTKDIHKAHRFAAALEAGTVWINMYRAIGFNSPYGGYKDSGIGRLNGFECMFQYLQTKSVWCDLNDKPQDPFVIKV